MKYRGDSDKHKFVLLQVCNNFRLFELQLIETWQDCNGPNELIRISGGTDYDTCGVTTTKYHYKTDDAYYVIWVDINTHQAVKVQGGPSGKNVKKPTYSSSYDDEYNTKDYSNAEDFYDDNYDNFCDYYDAEDYYNEHSD